MEDPDVSWLLVCRSADVPGKLLTLFSLGCLCLVFGISCRAHESSEGFMVFGRPRLLDLLNRLPLQILDQNRLIIP